MEPTTDEGEWQHLFTRERERLIGTLGAITDGGIVEQLEHVGATSVPGLYGRPILDIALAVWPFPLEAPAREALTSLGYALDAEHAGAPEQRFHHAAATFQLFVVESGSPRWTDFMLLRKHLRHDAAAREALSARKRDWEGGAEPAGYEEAKRRELERLVGDARRSWIAREGFAPIRSAAAEMRDFTASWYVGGGWALDLFLGRVTRVHHDADVAIARADQLALRSYLTAREWTLVTPYENRLEPWPPHTRLEMPRVQVHAHRRGAFMDFLLTDMDGEVWRYRREPVIVRHMARVGLRTDDGIPFLAPELVLLFKSKNTSGRERGKDQEDFEAVHALLEPERRAWLRWALTATDPSHPWVERL